MMIMDQSSRSSSPNNNLNNGINKNQSSSSSNYFNNEQIIRLKKLYPYTDLDLLPKQWSAKDKANSINLSEDGLKVHYKGIGKTHKDAAAIRASNSIPLSCLLYYYEVKIISKGRDGYMGIGLASQGVNMNRLPGWDKQSYGYHGDDGHSFNSSGTGQPYGPTFTTGDIIGCGYNSVENICFYTKNGHNLGVAFVDLPQVPLFPTVGLQTPGEELEANFGNKPFCYDIEQDLLKLRKKITSCINLYPVNHNEWQPMLHHLVQSWLIHNGYCSTAQVFAEYTHIPFTENIQNIKQRLKIQKLVLSGKIGEAISTTNRLYPSVLQDDLNLLFTLKCRQFIEFVCGNDDLPISSIKTTTTSNGNQDNNDCNGNSFQMINDCEMKMDLDLENSNNFNSNSDNCNNNNDNELFENNHTTAAINNNNNNNVNNMNTNSLSNIDRFKMILLFGKELNSLAQKLDSTTATTIDQTNINNNNNNISSNEINKKMLEEAWFFIAFADPNEANKYLNHLDRETVCQRLNNAIVNLNNNNSNTSNSNNTKTKVAIETVIKHTKALCSLNNYCGAWIMDNI